MKQGEARLRDLDALGLVTRIYEIGLLTSRSGGLDDVIQAIARRILKETDASYVGVGLVDASRREVAHRWGVLDDGSILGVGHRQAVGRGVVGQVAATGKPICLADVRSFSDYIDVVPGMKSELAVPLKAADDVFGVLDAESREPGAFGPASVALLQALATPVALAIQNAQLLQEERRRSGQLTLLNSVSRIITSTIDLDDLLERTVDEIRSQLDFYLVAVGLVDAEGARVVLRAASSRTSMELPIGHSQPLGRGVTGEVVKSGRSLLITDVREWPNYVAAAPEIRCEICCPLSLGDQAFGFLDAEATEPGAFDNRDMLILETLADHISQAVANVQALDRVNQLRDELSSMVIHDLRSPITVIRSSLDLLAPRLPEEDQGSDYMVRARSACDEMLVLIGGLLDLQKLESGEIDLHIQPCSAADLVRGVAQRLSVVGEARGVTLGSDVEDGLPVLHADVDLMTRVLENLVTNALKFTPQGGRITLTTGTALPAVVNERLLGAGDAVVFGVADTGPGIPLEARERIFDRFAVLEAGRDSAKRSSGLGLAFCKQAVVAHGGAIWVDSGEQGGSVFHVLLPLEPLPGLALSG